MTCYLRSTKATKLCLYYLIDYSPAFDTINHSMLFERFKRRYGICGTVLKWYVSYLDSRKQAIVIGDSISDTFPLPWGVPQGSVKGPLIWFYYVQCPIERCHQCSPWYPPCNLCRRHTTLSYYMESTHQSEAVNKLESCISDVRSWAIQNKLMLNDSKT